MAHQANGKRIALLVIGAFAAVLLLSVGGAAVALANDNGPSAFTLPSGQTGQLSQPDARWTVSSGQVGYRAKESAFGISHDVVGRTDKVTGSATTSAGSLTNANIEVQLTAFQVNGKTHTATSETVNAAAHPAASFTIDSPIKLSGSGNQTFDVPGQLTFNGTTKPATWHVSMAPTGDRQLAMVGNTTIDVTQWGVTPPSSEGVFDIGKDVTLEFSTTWTS